MEVTGAGSGTAYVSWLSDSNPAGYALFLRAFSVTRGWLSVPAQITTSYGSSSVWPGDTTGLSALSPTDVVASWGSDYPDVSGNQDEIYAANITAICPDWWARQGLCNALRKVDAGPNECRIAAC